MKRIAILLSLMLVVVIAAGCSGLSESEMKAVSNTVMNEKYGENFTVIETREYDNTCFYAWLRPDKNPDIVVRAEMNNDGSALSDNYVVRKICHQISDDVSLMLLGEDCYVFTKNILEYTLNESLGTTTQEHLETNPQDRFDIAVFVTKSASAERIYEMANAVEIPKGSINIIVVEPNELEDAKKTIKETDSLSADSTHTLIQRGKRIMMDLEKSIPSVDEIQQALER